MPADRFSVYRRGMVVLRAAENMMSLRIACAPTMEKDAKGRIIDELIRDIKSQDKPLELGPDGSMTHELIARLVNG